MSEGLKKRKGSEEELKRSKAGKSNHASLLRTCPTLDKTWVCVTACLTANYRFIYLLIEENCYIRP